MTFGDQFLTVAAIVLAFDLVTVTDLRPMIGGANGDDLRAVYGMAQHPSRIRRDRGETLTPYFTSADP